ncbi:Ribosomal protein S18 acetylase RimI [Ectopseudomonas composti]|uniref:Ribosomal protein S18 acetylase RimI n=1 Tax=Ectopseudomonas composti TaxID=658457 RepID=A0A1I5SMI5_9GAMM|nr:Ribosomal protein S18 acetylase RimI [Pseudomonas composti]
MIPNLRQATPQNLPFVFRLERAYIQDFESESLHSWQGAIDRHLEQWISNLSRMFVAESGDEVVGYYFWEVRGDEAILSSINVLPDQRRRGIGSYLLKHFETQAVKNGMTRLSLGVISHNPAKQLYEAAGYEFVHQKGDYCYYEKSPNGA